MKLPMRLGLLMMSLCALNFVMHAELLVIKKGEQGFVPLDASDEVNKAAIADVFLKYEWPMVIVNTALTKEEQNELLTSGKPYAEEEFIRNKLKAIDERYDVVFIPTVLYELFMLGELEWQQEFQRTTYVPKDQLNPTPLEIASKNHVGPSFRSILSRVDLTQRETYEKIDQQYQKDNNYFYPDAFFYVNNALVKILFDEYPKLKEASNGLALSSEIQVVSDQVAVFLIEHSGVGSAGYKRTEMLKNTNIINPSGAVAQVISIEYEARKLNKGLLLRGTSTVNIVLGKERELELLGSTVHESSDLLKSYKENANKPYSISFGNSLFAGWLQDVGASAYKYLTDINGAGYALFVDKKYYIKNRFTGPEKSLDLFFISTLAPIAAFFGSGEWFHSRTKAAAKFKQEGKETIVIGIAASKGGSPIDPAGVILIARDPLIHAQLFSEYLAKNMRIIGKRNKTLSGLTDEEKKAYEEKIKQESEKLKKGQEQAAKYYAAIKKLEPFAVKASQTFRQKQLEKEKKRRERIENAQKKAARKLMEQQRKSEASEVEYNLQKSN